jgi:hypothetical protein
MENILFIEKQQFRQPWLWVLLMVFCLFTLWGFIQQIILGIPWGSNPAPDGLLFFFTLLPFGLLWLFGIMSLKTEITNEEIRVSFFPFFRRSIKWEDIEEAYVRQYKPLAEYGGWGVRVSHKGLAYNVSGKMGLQLVLKKGKKRILIGTQLPDELQRVVTLIHPFVK